MTALALIALIIAAGTPGIVAVCRYWRDTHNFTAKVAEEKQNQQTRRTRHHV